MPLPFTLVLPERALALEQVVAALAVEVLEVDPSL